MNAKNDEDKEFDELKNNKIQENLRLLLLIRTYQSQGFLDSNIDPLYLNPTSQSGNIYKSHIEGFNLNYQKAGFSEADLVKQFNINNNIYNANFEVNNSN